MLNEPSELYYRNCYACHKPKPPDQLQPGVSRKPDRTTKPVEICNTCADEMELIPDGDEWEDEDESEGKSQDEIFGDDCDAGYRMDQARGLK